jgi:glycerol-3-phosphate dehydrogenase subunit C
MTLDSPDSRKPPGVADILGTMDNCTKCGICQSHCPVVGVTTDFPGPKYAGPQAERYRVIGTSLDHSTDLCTGCGICSSVCPNDVAISDIITIARASNMTDRGSLPMAQRLLNRPDLIGSIAGRVPELANSLLRNRPLRRLAERFLGIHRDAPLPTIRGPVFRKWIAARSQPDGPAVLYFPGCSVENFDPETGMSTVRVLNRLGYRARIGGPSCCSLPMLSTGEWGPARSRARRVVDALSPEVGAIAAIVASSTSCGLTLKSKFAAYLDMTDGRSAAVSASVTDICQFIRDGRHSNGELSHPVRTKVLYHPPCQLRAHGVGFPALEIMRTIPGLNVVTSESACCGIGGTYGYDRNRHRVSMSIVEALRDQVAAERPDAIVCDSETCRWHLQSVAGVPAVHPVQLIDAAMHGSDRQA